MEKVYYWVGFSIIWILIFAICMAILSVIVMLIYGLVLRLWKDNFIVVYHIRRKRFYTEALRKAYITHYENKRLTKWTLKFRLRNIKYCKTALSKGHIPNCSEIPNS